MIERVDMTLVMAWLALLVAGLVLVSSAAVAQAGGADYYLGKQALFAAAALLLFFVFAAVPIRTWATFHRHCLLLAIALCALVLVPALSVEVNGARRWIDLGVARFQPAEAAKLLAVLYLAGYVARVGDGLSTRWATLITPLVWIGALLLLLLLQPDFGTVVVLAALTAGLLFLGGARVRDFSLLAVLGGIALAAAAVWDPYRIVRLVTFLDLGRAVRQRISAHAGAHWVRTGRDPRPRPGPRRTEALLSPGSAQRLHLFGDRRGAGLGWGGCRAGPAFAFVTVRILCIARAAAAEQRTFAALVAYGAALLIGAQTVINVGVNTGVLPTKGLTLPFISFGGNSLLVCSALVALALRVQYERRPRRGEAHD